MQREKSIFILLPDISYRNILITIENMRENGKLFDMMKIKPDRSRQRKYTKLT